jgi:hypothetical protein
MISAANEAGDRNNPTNAVQIRLRASLIGQKDCVILPQLSARLGLRQGQEPGPAGRARNLTRFRNRYLISQAVLCGMSIAV